jgi:hypothetical protein
MPTKPANPAEAAAAWHCCAVKSLLQQAATAAAATSTQHLPLYADTLKHPSSYTTLVGGGTAIQNNGWTTPVAPAAAAAL